MLRTTGIFSIFLVICGCATPMCPGNKPMPPYQNCANVYPPYGRSVSGSISLDLQVAEVKLSNLKLAIASDIVKLKQDYDQITNTLELGLKGICVGFNSNPCDDQTRMQLAQDTTAITKKIGDIQLEVQKLKSLAQQLQPGAVTKIDEKKLTEQVKDLKSKVADLGK